MIKYGQLALPQFPFIILHIIVIESKVEFNDIHDFFFFFFFFFWPTYRPIFLATMIRETRNRLGVALLLSEQNISHLLLKTDNVTSHDSYQHFV